MFGIKLQPKKDATAGAKDRPSQDGPPVNGSAPERPRPQRGPRKGQRGGQTRTSRAQIISAAGKNQRKVIRVGLLLIVGIAGISGGFLALSHSKGEIAVYATVRAIPKGAQISRSDLTLEKVPLPGVVGALPESAIVGAYASTPILQGEVFTSGMALSSELSATEAVIGVSLAPGRMPATGITTGSSVEVIFTGVGASGVSVSRGASSTSGVSSAGAEPGDVLGTAIVSSSTPGSSGTGAVVDLLTPINEASVIAAAASQGNIAIARIS